jgi:hypothetical protein
MSAPEQEPSIDVSALPRAIDLESIGRTRRWLRRAAASVDWVATLAALLVASALFVLTFYDDTWGSGPDLIQAFGAGFVGRVVVDWAQLAAFRRPSASPRIRNFAPDGVARRPAEPQQA